MIGTPLSVVFRRVVLLVSSREEMEHRNLRRVKRCLVGRTVAVAARSDRETETFRRFRDDVRPLRSRFGTESDESVIAQPADHIEVHHRDNVAYVEWRS